MNHLMNYIRRHRVPLNSRKTPAPHSQIRLSLLPFSLSRTNTTPIALPFPLPSFSRNAAPPSPPPALHRAAIAAPALLRAPLPISSLASAPPSLPPLSSAPIADLLPRLRTDGRPISSLASPSQRLRSPNPYLAARRQFAVVRTLPVRRTRRSPSPPFCSHLTSTLSSTSHSTGILALSIFCVMVAGILVLE